jgi:hypothetical protein
MDGNDPAGLAPEVGAGCGGGLLACRMGAAILIVRPARLLVGRGSAVALCTVLVSVRRPARRGTAATRMRVSWPGASCGRLQVILVARLHAAPVTRLTRTSLLRVVESVIARAIAGPRLAMVIA